MPRESIRRYMYQRGEQLRVGDDVFVVVEIIGQGGMGIVLLVRDTSLGLVKAMKVLLPEATAQDPKAEERFRHEARVGAILEHRNLVKVERLGKLDDGNPFFLMEYIEGESIWHAQRRRAEAGDRRFSVAETLNIGYQLLAGLAHAHSREIIHCDIKPGNILLGSRDGEPHVWVGDFGVMRLHDDGVRGFGGTLAYASYEQVALEALTPKSDIHSVGVMLFEMLTGKLPFGRAPRETTLGEWHERMRRGAPSLATFGQFNEELVDVITSALAVNPEARPEAHRFGERLFAILRKLTPEEGEDPHTAITVERPLAEIHARMYGTALTRDSLDPTEPTRVPSEVLREGARSSTHTENLGNPGNPGNHGNAGSLRHAVEFMSTEQARHAGAVNRTEPLPRPPLRRAPSSDALSTLPPGNAPNSEPPVSALPSTPYIDSTPIVPAHLLAARPQEHRADHAPREIGAFNNGDAPLIDPTPLVVVANGLVLEHDPAAHAVAEHIIAARTRAAESFLPRDYGVESPEDVMRNGARPNTSLEPRPPEVVAVRPRRPSMHPSPRGSRAALDAFTEHRRQHPEELERIRRIQEAKRQGTFAAQTAVDPPSLRLRLRWFWDSLSTPLRWILNLSIFFALMSLSVIIVSLINGGLPTMKRRAAPSVEVAAPVDVAPPVEHEP